MVEEEGEERGNCTGKGTPLPSQILGIGGYVRETVYI